MTNVNIGYLKPADCFAHTLMWKQTIIDVPAIVGRLKMSKKQEELTELFKSFSEGTQKGLYKVVNKLEQRIASLEKVLVSHAKCIGEMREDNNDNIN